MNTGKRYCKRCLAEMEYAHEEDGGWLMCTGCEDSVSAEDGLLSLSEAQVTMILEAEAEYEERLTKLADEAVEKFLGQKAPRW